MERSDPMLEPDAAAPPPRGWRAFFSSQSRWSLLLLVSGMFSLAVALLGTAAVLWAHGVVPSEKIAEGLKSRAMFRLLILSGGLGFMALVAGVAVYRKMDSRQSREGAIAGAVLGGQAVVFSLAMLWFRAGDLTIIARQFFDIAPLRGHLGLFARGAWNTVVLAFGGELLGIALGLVLALFVLSHRPAVRAPARLYINFFRGTPLLWQLSFFYLGIVLGLRFELTTYQAAILILGMNAGAYSAEIFRAGIQSVDRGQFEAARSLGMSYAKALRYVILPQGIRKVIPPLTNEFVILIKDTSLVSVLGLTFAQRELMSVGRSLYADFFSATPFLASAAGYLIITIPMIRVVTALERKLRSGLTGVGA